MTDNLTPSEAEANLRAALAIWDLPDYGGDYPTAIEQANTLAEAARILLAALPPLDSSGDALELAMHSIPAAVAGDGIVFTYAQTEAAVRAALSLSQDRPEGVRELPALIKEAAEVLRGIVALYDEDDDGEGYSKTCRGLAERLTAAAKASPARLAEAVAAIKRADEEAYRPNIVHPMPDRLAEIYARAALGSRDRSAPDGYVLGEEMVAAGAKALREYTAHPDRQADLLTADQFVANRDDLLARVCLEAALAAAPSAPSPAVDEGVAARIKREAASRYAHHHRPRLAFEEGARFGVTLSTTVTRDADEARWPSAADWEKFRTAIQDQAFEEAARAARQHHPDERSRQYIDGRHDAARAIRALKGTSPTAQGEGK